MGKDIIIKNVVNAMGLVKLNKLSIIIIFLINTIVLTAQKNTDRIILNSGETIKCYLLIKGQKVENLNIIKILTLDYKIKYIENGDIKRVYDLNNNLLYSKQESKNNNTITTNKPTTKQCTACEGSGYIISACTFEGCNNGKILSACNYCKKDYKNATDVCPKCHGEGCEYCGFDGFACDACNGGFTEANHKACNGLGKTTIKCKSCNGTGIRKY